MDRETQREQERMRRAQGLKVKEPEPTRQPIFGPPIQVREIIRKDSARIYKIGAVVNMPFSSWKVALLLTLFFVSQCGFVFQITHRDDPLQSQVQDVLGKFDYDYVKGSTGVGVVRQPSTPVTPKTKGNPFADIKSLPTSVRDVKVKEENKPVVNGQHRLHRMEAKPVVKAEERAGLFEQFPKLGKDTKSKGGQNGTVLNPKFVSAHRDERIAGHNRRREKSKESSRTESRPADRGPF